MYKNRIILPFNVKSKKKDKTYLKGSKWYCTDEFLSKIVELGYETYEWDDSDRIEGEIVLNIEVDDVQWYNTDDLSQKVSTKSFVKDLLLKKQREEAIQYLADCFLTNNYVYTIRDDDRVEMWIYDQGIYVPHGKTFIQQYVFSILEEVYTANMANRVADIVAVQTYISLDVFFTPQQNEYICVKNGLFNLDKKKLEPFNPKYIFFSKFNAKYKKNAKCLKIKKFIREIIGRPDDEIVIKQLFGWLFFKYYAFEIIFMFLGDGGNGKSKLVELIKLFAGEKNCTQLQPQVFENPESFSIKNLFGKIANLAPDIAPTALKNTSVLKFLSGNDTIQAQRKFKEDISFRNSAKLIFGANELPITYDTKDAFWRRWILLEFPFKFIPEDEFDNLTDEQKEFKKKRIENIIENITSEDELSGLLNWALEGYYELKSNKKFTYYHTPDEVRQIWIRRSDSFRAFINDNCLVDADQRCKKEELRRSYSEYCKKHKIKNRSDRHISYILSEEGVSSRRIIRDKEDYYCWEGLKLIDSPRIIDNDYADQPVIKLINEIKQNNYTIVESVFGIQKVKKLIELGIIYEMPKGTLKVNK